MWVYLMRFLQFNDAMREVLYGLLFVCSLWGGMAQAQELRHYAIDISLPKGGHLSGVCIIRTEGENGVMSVINEFGIKAFDAVYTGKKNRVKLKNVIPPLNRWYVRKVIAKDMSFLFNPDKKLSRHRSLSREENGSIVLSNKRFNIVYNLQPIKENVTE